MTIKQPNKEVEIKINISKIIFWGALALSTFLLGYTIVGNVHSLLILFVLPVAFASLFVDADDLELDYGKKSLGIIVMFIFIIISVCIAISAGKAEFIETIKKDHPQLITKYSKCSGVDNEPISEYKLIKINDVYYVKTDDEKHLLKNVELYKYEEF